MTLDVEVERSRMPVMERRALGQLLRTLTERERLTQADLARELDVARTTISRIFSGQIVKSQRYVELCTYFGLPLREATEQALSLEQALPRVRPAPPLDEDSEDPQQEEPARAGSVLAVCAEKGGVGKTTTAVNLASIWAARGRRVLLVDLDHQGTASKYALGESSQGRELCGALRERRAPQVQSSAWGFDVIPGGRALSEAKAGLMSDPVGQVALKRVLEPIASRYDLVVLDTPPSLDIISVGALVAATHVLVPVQLESPALDGLERALVTIEEIRQTLNPALQYLGAVGVMFDQRTRVHTQTREELAGWPEALMLETLIHRNTRLVESITVLEPINHYDATARGAREYEVLAAELEELIDG